MNIKKECGIKRIFVLLVIVLFLNMPLVSALEISNVRVEEITGNGAVVKWETDEAANSFVSYGTDKGDLTPVGDARSVQDHSFDLVGLLNSTTYFFKVKSGEVEEDNDGELYSFETLEADTTAPVIEAEIPELVGDDKIDIFGSTEVGAEVRLEINGAFAGMETAEEGNFSFIDVRLKADDWNLILIEAEDKAGNINGSEFRTFSDVSKPRIELKELPEIVTESKIKLEGSLSENASLSVLVNNRSVYSEETDKILVEVSLQEGENNITVVAEDKAGLKDEAEAKVFLDTRPPEVKAELAKGNSYYQGRAETDITGETKPGAKVYLYFFKRDPFEREPDFSRAYAVTTADEEGKFKFSEVDFEHPPITLKDLAPKEIPVGLKEMLISPFEVIKEQQQWMYEVYLVAEDTLGRTGFRKLLVTIYTCYTAEYAFHVDPMVEFQMPYRLDPGMLDEGRQIISSIINLSYIGGGISTDEDEGFRVGFVKLEKACTPGMLEESGFKISCKIFPRVARPKSNPDKTAWFMQTTLARTEDLSKRKDDFWNDFKDRQLVFPMKMTISYQEKGADGKWGNPKTQVSCFDLGYFVDIPLESGELIPDFLANEGVEALNWTIDKIDVVMPYLQKAMLVTGIGCGISILAKMATRWYRLFISKLEPVWTKTKKKEEQCPSGDAQDKLILKSTNDGEGWPPERTAGDEETLDKKCSQTAGAWKAEAALNTALRWVCDRFFCHEAPAAWTEDKDKGEVMAAKLKEQACGSQGGRGIPLRKIENCKKYIEDEEHKKEIAPTVDIDFIKTHIKGNICYFDSSSGEIYFVDKTTSGQGKEGKWELTPIGTKIGEVGEISMTKTLVAYQPEGADNFFVAQKVACEDLCSEKDYKGSGCWEVTEKGDLKEPEKMSGDMYVADYTADCFPQEIGDPFMICVCERKIKEEVEKGEGTREAEKEEDWSYRQAMLFRETGGNKETCGGGKAGTCYPAWRYHSGRDMSAAFGQSHIIDVVTGSEDITQVNPFTQHLGAFQSVCLSGIYNRLKLLQSTLIGMRNCLIEAKYTGLHDAGMCKEIFSQAVCGLIYKAIAYAAKGCLPIPFFDIDKKGDESVWGKGVEFGLGAIHDTLETTMGDLQDEYGNAQLSEFFSVGVQGVTTNICLAAFGYDWPYGVDFLMDSAYRVPMKTTALVVPAERELVSYNPMKGTAIYNYRVGASIFPGCKIRSYTVKLKCVGKNDEGNKNLRCDSYEDCPCLAATETYAEAQKEYVLYSSVTGVKPGNYVSIPVPSPTPVDRVFRYDHVVLELQLDRFEDPAKCFEKEYIEGSKGVFYFPITDVSPKPLVACKADIKTGQFYCPDLGGFFGAMGTTYLQSPYVECKNERLGVWRSCEAQNNFLLGESIKIKPHIFSDGKKQCLHVTLTGVGKNIYPIPEDMGPTLRPEFNLGVVTEELLSGTGGAEIKWDGSSCGTPSSRKSTGEVPSYLEVTFTYKKVEEGKYTLYVNKQVEVEGFSISSDNYLMKDAAKELTSGEIKSAVFHFGGYEVENVVDLTKDSGSCKYEIRAGRTQTGRDVKDLGLTLELRYPGEGGDCTAATKRIPPTLGETYHRMSLQIQRKEIYEAVGEISELHKYWKAKQYEALRNKAAKVIAEGRGSLDEVIAYYYAVAASIMLEDNMGAMRYIESFYDRKGGYSSEIKKSGEYKKIKKYLDTIYEKK